MTGGRLLVVGALVLLGTLVVPCSGDRQLSGDPRTGGDDELNRATAACPDDFTECGGRCYHAIADYYTYTEAVEYCIDMGGILATPRTAEENECANGVASAARIHHVFWIGYRGGDTADSFVGADCGGKMTYTNWHTDGNPRPPYLDDADNCVLLYASNGPWGGNWADVRCDNTRYVLCQTQN